MTSSISNHYEVMTISTTYEGLKVIRDKSPQYGYKIVKIEESNNFKYFVTMKKVKKLRHYGIIQ